MSSAPDWAAQLEAILRVRLGADGSHDIGHFRRVWQQAQDIAAIEGGDMEVLAAAAWFHDLVNPPKDSPDRARASVLSAEEALPILRAEGFPETKLDSVRNAIEAHSFSAGITPQTLEARILQDADRLDAIGAIGIARSFYVAGRMGSALFNPDDPLAQDRQLDDRSYALDHFEVKLFRIAETMKTDTGRRIATHRAEIMRSFVSTLMSEIKGESSAIETP